MTVESAGLRMELSLLVVSDTFLQFAPPQTLGYLTLSLPASSQTDQDGFTDFATYLLHNEDFT